MSTCIQRSSLWYLHNERVVLFPRNWILHDARNETETWTRHTGTFPIQCEETKATYGFPWTGPVSFLGSLAGKCLSSLPACWHKTLCSSRQSSSESLPWNNRTENKRKLKWNLLWPQRRQSVASIPADIPVFDCSSHTLNAIGGFKKTWTKLFCIETEHKWQDNRWQDFRCLGILSRIRDKNFEAGLVRKGSASDPGYVDGQTRRTTHNETSAEIWRLSFFIFQSFDSTGFVFPSELDSSESLFSWNELKKSHLWKRKNGTHRFSYLEVEDFVRQGVAAVSGLGHQSPAALRHVTRLRRLPPEKKKQPLCNSHASHASETKRLPIEIKYEFFWNVLSRVLSHEMWRQKGNHEHQSRCGIQCHAWCFNYRYLLLNSKKEHQVKILWNWVKLELSRHNNTAGIKMWFENNLENQFRFKHIRIKRDPPVAGFECRKGMAKFYWVIGWGVSFYLLLWAECNCFSCCLS